MIHIKTDKNVPSFMSHEKKSLSMRYLCQSSPDVYLQCVDSTLT